MPGAEVKATQTATGVVRTMTSGQDGAYILTSLPIGPYMLEVSKNGFNKYVQSGIVLQVDSNPTIDATLEGRLGQRQVMVEADAPWWKRTAPASARWSTTSASSEMPLNGRNATELIFLAGMANYARQRRDSIPSGTIPRSSSRWRADKAMDSPTCWTAPITTIAYNNLNLPLPFPDALQEFKVETSALPAQYGHSLGAAVNAVTKSGTNEFHGDVFEFLRNGDFNARNFFATTRDTLKRNQFGGTSSADPS